MKALLLKLLMGKKHIVNTEIASDGKIINITTEKDGEKIKMLIEKNYNKYNVKGSVNDKTIEEMWKKDQVKNMLKQYNIRPNIIELLEENTQLMKYSPFKQYLIK